MSCTEIGSGGYGVVFRPPLGSNDSSMVGKVLFNDDITDVEREWFNVKKIMKMDPEQNFFLYPVKQEEIDVSEYNKYAKTPLEGTRRQLTQFTIRDGGVSLRNYQYQSFEHILIHILQVCQSIQFMLKNDIVHHDIHLGNIMSNGIDNCKIIDFGLSKNSKTFYSSANYLWSAEYAVNPPEFRLVQSRNRQTHNVFVEKQLLAKYVSIDTPYIDYIYVNPAFIQSYNDLNTSIVGLVDTGKPTKKDTLKFLKSINCHETTDVYGLGIAMIEVLAKNGHLEVQDDIYMQLWGIITYMVMPHPKHRMSVETVVKEIECLLQTFQKNKIILDSAIW